MKRILFVDDEPKVLDGLQRMLYPLRNDWEMVFVASTQEALECLAKSEFDVLVTDVRMPEMAGMQLLAEVVERYPKVIRMILSGSVEQEMTLPSVMLAHQYLIKPCHPDTLRSAVERVAKFKVMLDDPQLRLVISKTQSLPSIPA